MRSTPSPRAFFGLCLMARGRLGRQPPVPTWTGTAPCPRRREDSPPPRRRRGVASAGGPSWYVPVAGWWPSLRHQPSAHMFGAWGHTSPTPR